MKQICLIIGTSLVLVVLLELTSFASAQSGSGPDFGRPIKCYQCNSFYDKGCADFFDNKTYPLIPCSTNATMCRKIIQETYYDGVWDVRYIRQCAQRGEVGPEEGRWCKERSGTYRVKVKYCHCDNKDGCNSAPSTFSPHFFWLALLALPILLRVT
ncbi:hypothetical protein CAPTEDRAFT_181564 [Capitella teleta]|uniref:Protein sleepless n=1 Tax=Capitella teleta TaxID=283909 RepID=R7URW9_CAPTE|nr:hypothetical protein CAPTEDRAFT_181564 [Capitella teleta]|eukprot:ELU06131.1 hypothetical protein CAPTEDRAFT_181564 [Capitella teleta]